MLEYIIIQKADKNNVIVLINKNYYVRKYHYTKGDKCNNSFHKEKFLC